MVITFTGHASISFHERVKGIVKEAIRSNILKSSTVTCYLGGYGDFDEISARACKELKDEGFKMELIYVTPYINETKSPARYDGTIYPPIENTPPKFAIKKRNEWMISNSDTVIAYVNHNFGGAYNSLQYAKRKKKKIINVCDV